MTFHVLPPPWVFSSFGGIFSFVRAKNFHHFWAWHPLKADQVVAAAYNERNHMVSLCRIMTQEWAVPASWFHLQHFFSICVCVRTRVRAHTDTHTHTLQKKDSEYLNLWRQKLNLIPLKSKTFLICYDEQSSGTCSQWRVNLLIKLGLKKPLKLLYDFSKPWIANKMRNIDIANFLLCSTNNSTHIYHF